MRGALLANIRLTMGESANAALAPLLGIGSVALVFLAIIAYVNGVLGRFRKISPAEAVRFGVAQEKPGGCCSSWMARLPANTSPAQRMQPANQISPPGWPG